MSQPQFDSSSDPAPSKDDSPTANRNRSFLGITFVCCQTYGRIYPNQARTAYVGHCPKCAKRVEVRIGPGGQSSRFFRAG